MKFKIDKDDSKVVKAIRFPVYLVDKINKICKKEHITFSRFIILACKYALDNIDNKNN